MQSKYLLILVLLSFFLTGCPYKTLYHSKEKLIKNNKLLIEPETVFWQFKKDSFHFTFGFSIKNNDSNNLFINSKNIYLNSGEHKNEVYAILKDFPSNHIFYKSISLKHNEFEQLLGFLVKGLKKDLSDTIVLKIEFNSYDTFNIPYYSAKVLSKYYKYQRLRD